MRNDWAALIRQLAPRFGIDPQAALAVASMEGLSGRVGDNGTSFGPFQLHVGGALPAGKGRAWAESQDGIEYALRQMAQSGARGKSGSQSIDAIVRRFERPANPDAEVAGANARYGHGPAVDSGSPARSSSSGMGSPGAGGGSADGGALRSAILASLMAPTTQGKADNFDPNAPSAVTGKLLSALLGAGSTSPTPSGLPAMNQLGAGVRGAGAGTRGPVGGRLAELFYDPLGGIKNGKQIGAIGGHSDHVHIATSNAAAMLAAIHQAQGMGLHVGENMAVGDKPEAGIHVKDSYHYRVFPKSHVNEASDVSGDPKQMAAFYKWAARRFR